MRFTIRLAGKNIRIESAYTRIYDTCRNYLAEGEPEPDIDIRVDEGRLAAERELARQAGREEAAPEALEDLVVHRLIAEAMLPYHVMLMHGAVVAANEQGYMFTGRSGTGKTTHIRKWLEQAPGAFVVNGDKPLIEVREDGVFAWGTPWCGKERMGRNTVVPLRGIALMERSEGNRMEAVSFQEALPGLLRQTYRPGDPDKMKQTMVLLMMLRGRVSFYRFRFNNFREDAFSASYGGMTKEKERAEQK